MPEARTPEPETIIELVDNVPLWALMLAAAVGGIVVFSVMIAVSKAPDDGTN